MASKSSSLLFLVLIDMLVSLGLAQAQLILPPIVPLPGFPGIPIPKIPIIPTPPLPEFPAPEIPGLPIPKIPIIPTPPLPEFPEPQIPRLPVPKIPRIPGTPEVQIPNIPGVLDTTIPTPQVPEFPAPEIPGLPIPRIPGIPGTPGAQIPTIPRVPIPGFPDISGPPEIQECWASIINIGGCYAEIFRAFQSGQASFTVGPTCCKAVKDISSTCWPRMFPFNPFFPPQLQNYCSRYINPLPAVPPTTDVPVPYVAPAPEEDSPVAPVPEEDVDALEFLN